MDTAVSWCVGAALVVALTCLGRAATASPAAAASVDASVHDCPDISVFELRRLLAVELAGRVLPAPSGNARATTQVRPERISVECSNTDSASTANVSVSGNASGRTASSTISLAGVPAQHRSRLLAIAIVELMSEVNGAAPPGVDHPEQIAVAPVATPIDTGPPGGTRWRWRFDLASMALRTSGLDTFLWGAMGRASIELSRWLDGEVDVESAGNSTPLPLGSAGILLVAAGASALARIGRGPLECASGVGLRGGLVRIAGTPASGAATVGLTVIEPWGGPFLTTRLAAHAGRHLSLLLSLEGGFSLSAVVGTVNSAKEVDVGPWWLGMSLGLGWNP